MSGTDPSTLDYLRRRLARERQARETAEALIESRTRELFVARLNAEAANRAKSDFLANMGHELRTPLNAILGFSDILALGIAGDLTPRQKEYVEDIRQSGQRLIALINQILDTAHLSLDQDDIPLSPVALAPILHEVYQSRIARARQAEIRLSVEWESDQTILGNAAALRQIIGNILDNALKFTPPGGRVVMSLKAGDSSGEVQVTVADNGPGIPEAERPHVFEPFHQISQGLNRAHEGAGLGLTLARHLVTLQRGRIQIHDNPGGGTLLCLVFPVMSPEDAALKQAP